MAGPRMASALRALLVAVERGDRGLGMKREPDSEKHAHFCDCDECLNCKHEKTPEMPVRTIETPFRETTWNIEK